MSHCAHSRKRPAPTKASSAKKDGGAGSAVSRKEAAPSQSSMGAQYSGGPVRRLGIQTKLTVGRVGDNYEREADKVAERVTTGQPAGEVSRIPAGGLAAQRKTDVPDEAQTRAQREEDAGEGDGAPTAETQRKSDGEEAATTQRKDEGEDDAQAQRKDESEDDAQAQRKDEGEDEAQAQRKDEGEDDAQAQRKDDDADEEAQAKCAACEQEEKGQRKEDGEDDAQAQREDEGEDDAQAQRKDDGADEEAQAKCAACEQEEKGQRKEEEGGDDTAQAKEEGDDDAMLQRRAEPSEAAGGEEDSAQAAAGPDPELGHECDPADAGDSESEGTAEPAAEEHGDELGCGEGEEAGAEGEGAAAEGGHSCGGEEAATEGAEGGGGGGVAEGEPAAEAERDPGAGAAVPSCAAETVGAAGESATETAPTTGEGGGNQEGGECGPAQRKEEESSESEQAQTARKTSTDPVKRENLDTANASRLIHARGAGEPLKPDVKHRLEASLGVDVNGIRVHSDGNAQAASRALRAKAFTHRNHIFLGAGQSQHDMNLMAHEGTHVLQQEGITRRKPEAASAPEGRVAAPAGGGASVAEGGGATMSGRALPGAKVPDALDPAKGAASAIPGSPAGSAAPVAPGSPAPPAQPGAATQSTAKPGTATAAPAGKKDAAAAPETTPKAAEMSARPPAAATSATGAASRGDVAPVQAPVMSRSIAPPDPSAFTGEPSNSLSALAALSPVRAPFAFRMFSEGVDGSLKRRRASEHRDAPHGRYQVRSPNLPDGRPAPTPVLTGPTPTTGAFAPAPVQAPAKVTVAAAEAGPAPAIDTASGEREVEAVDEKKPNAIQIVREWMRRFFASVPTSDNNVNTDPGPVPTITYDKDSDPAQIQSIEDEHKATAIHGLEEADEQRDDDFGEHEIEPELEDGEEKIAVPAHVHQRGTGCDPEAEAEPLAFDPPHEAELAGRVHAETGSRWTAEADLLDASEEERDRKIAGERMALPGRIADAHAAAYHQEDEAAAAARTEVSRLRESWGGENRGVQTRFEGETGKQAQAQRLEVSGHVAKEEGFIGDRHATDKAAAEDKKKVVEEAARKEKEEAERKAKEESSGGLLSRGVSWIKNKAKSALAWAVKKVKGWFDDLRAWVRKKFDEFKQWVNDKIEAARRWINEKLEGLRRRFHALVDKYLSEYPGIAKRFHNLIDKGIDGAQAAVNRAAEGLKRAVNKLIDAAAKAVDATLAVAEKAVVWALTVACDTVVIGSNLVVAFVEGDLQSMITLVRELPDWPPLFGGLMSVVRAGFLGFLERMHGKPPDMKKRFVEKLRGLLSSGKYYGGVFLGILNGLVIDGLWGTIKMIYEIITSIPQIITDIHDAIKRLASDVEAIAAIADQFDATKAEVKAFLDRPESAHEMVAMLKRSPEILVAMVDKAMHEGREWAYRAGAKAADALFNWILTASNFDIGLAVGTFIGRVIFEVLLLVFTAGAGTAIKWGGKAVQWLLKGLRMLTGGMRKGGGLIMKGINLLREIVVAGLTAAKKLGGTIKKVLAKIGALVDKVFDWFRRAFGKVGRKLARKASPQERAKWIRFKLEVKEALAGHPDGMTKGAVQGIYRGIITRYRDVVGWPTVITKKGAYFRLWARPAKGLRPRPVGRVLQDRDTRWKEGKKAVEDAIKDLKRRVDNIDAGRINAALAQVKKDFRYKILQTSFDEATNLFVVEGAMSAKKKVVKAKPKRPTDNKVTIQQDSKHIRVNPLVTRTAVRSAPAGDPPHWAEVQKIRTVRGKTSLYRQGHLVSGFFLGGDAWNLTPITFSANGLMATRAETPVRKKLPIAARASSNKPVFTYDVKAEGKAGATDLKKRAFMKDGKPVCETVPAEAKLYTKINITISQFGYNDKSHKWDRSVSLAKDIQPGPIHNLPPFPLGKPCVTPRKNKKKGSK